jgi:hypothetical protein
LVLIWVLRPDILFEVALPVVLVRATRRWWGHSDPSVYDLLRDADEAAAGGTPELSSSVDRPTPGEEGGGDPSEQKLAPTRRPRSRLIADFTIRGKLRFGTPRRTAANHMAVRRFVQGLMESADIRYVDQISVLDRVTAAIFVPSREELDVAQSFDDPKVSERLAAYEATGIGGLSK